MAMNFWEAERKARTLTTIYLTVFIGLTLAIAVLSEVTMRYAAGDSYDDSFPYVGVLFLTITFLVAAFQYFMFQSYGGGYVAESVGAQRLGPGNAEGNEKVRAPGAKNPPRLVQRVANIGDREFLNMMLHGPLSSTPAFDHWTLGFSRAL